MASKNFIVKKNSFMFMMMGTLVLLLTTFFTVNSNTSLRTNASVGITTSATGTLMSDPNHLLPCNKGSQKSDYVLQNTNFVCLPLVVGSQTADPYVGKTVLVYGYFSKTRFYVTSIQLLPATSPAPTPVNWRSPWPLGTPVVDGTPVPVNDMPGTGPADSNPFQY